MTGKELGRGAEAVIHKTAEGVNKHRLVKTYRHPVLDAALRKQRTRKEAKILQELEKIGVPVPKLVMVDDKQGLITMSFIAGQKVRDVLETNISLLEIVGGYVGKLHDHNIIHGDLTTSNMIATTNDVVLIDFGLSVHSTKIEDKAVDLHLLQQALESKHHTIASESWQTFLKGYAPKEKKVILERLVLVKKRGRNKV